MTTTICLKCRKMFQGHGSENRICRLCLIEEIKDSINSSLPKHEKPKINNLTMEDAWIIPDKKKNI